MKQQVFKGVRFPAPLVKRIEKAANEDGSTFSQFVRTATIRELNARERGAA